MLRVLSLCSGIGGFELGILAADLHHAIAPAQFVERDSYCQKILARWFPTVPIHSDLETFHPLLGTFDLLCAGFPCQPHSLVGNMEGREDERNLWPHIYRIIKQVKPIGFILENVPGLRHSNKGNFFKGILQDIADAGYICQWDTITVKSLGGVHERERLFIVAYTKSERRDTLQPAIATQTRTNQTSIPLSSTTVPGWTQTISEFYRVDDGLASLMAGCLMSPEQLPIAKTIATRKASKAEVAPGLQAVGNSISPQCAAIAWKKLYEKLY